MLFRSNARNIAKGSSLLLRAIIIPIILCPGTIFLWKFKCFVSYFLCSEFKEAFPAGRFRPVCKIQAKRGASSAAVADQIKPPEWWHSTRIIQAFDAVLADRVSHSIMFLTPLFIYNNYSTRNPLC